MRKLLSLFVLLLAAGAQGSECPTVLVFGDSLSAGYGIDVDKSWTALLQTRLEEQGYEHRVVNASISGETTEGGAARIEAALETFSPELVILQLGGNDGLRGFPPARMRANLESIVTNAQSSGAAVVLLGIKIPSNYGPRYSRAFESIFRDVAVNLDIPWVEFCMEGIALNDVVLQAARIHPTAEAQPLLLDNAWPVISVTLDAQ